MKVHDVSMAVHPGMPVWPGDPAPDFQAVATLESDGVRVSRLVLGSHSGTHLDAPAHFLPDASTIDSAPLEALIGPCRLLEVETPSGKITARDLSGHAPFRPGERILLKTSNSLHAGESKFRPDFVALDESAARALAEAGVGLVGIDYLSVEGYGCEEFPVHLSLLRAGVWLLEGLDLHAVAAGEYTLIALPLKLTGLEASPVRAVLVENGL
ncbi:MAG: cyclase family protein [Armatimonadetes bacterium]|nr:cyclase family protein [Armatimonadota bacterium]